MVTDPLGDFIVQLRNASMVRRESVSIPFSNFKLAVAEKMREEGFIKSVSKKGKKTKRTLDIELAYASGGAPLILGVRRVSKPGRRLYAGSKELGVRRASRGVLFLSTPKGILTESEARKAKVGGETLFSIW